MYKLTLLAALALLTISAVTLPQRSGVTIDQFRQVRAGDTRSHIDSLFAFTGEVIESTGDTTVVAWRAANGLGDAKLSFYRQRVLPDIPGEDFPPVKAVAPAPANGHTFDVAISVM